MKRLLMALALMASLPDDEITLDRDDILITKSVKVKPGTYRVTDANDNGIVHIKGDDITVDFQGAVLVGSPDEAKADQYKGWGVVAEGCKRLTVKNLIVRGLKIGMYFKNCDGLTVVGCDVSRNWRMHLRSTPKGEAGEDWLYGHENDNHEWFRYGAGIYVESSKKAALWNNRGRNGQNGICIDRVTDSWIFDNDMSFMSGWGLAMWRSCRNEVSNNKFDWCIRGFSYKVYHRGQDSAGIFVFEQCSDNVFACNSATHGGDGFFLYAGNETLNKTGEGGCNRNLLYRNDFSHAAANGIEATFSDGNRFIENILDECDHGVWGGYSYNTAVVGNTIRNCNNGISIEHGHGNRIEGNTLEKNGLGISLWWNANEEFKRTPYGQKVDTASHAYTIVRNIFKENRRPIRLGNTSDVTISENGFDGKDPVELAGGCEKVRRDDVSIPKYDFKVPKTRGTQDAYLPKGARRGWKYIFVDDWGPYDFSKVRLFPDDVAAWGSAELYLLGPDGSFDVSDITGGVSVTPTSGKIPATLKIASEGDGVREFAFTVKSGGETVKASGILLHAKWNVKFFAWESQEPKKPPKDWDAVVKGKVLDEMTLDRIDFVWGAGAPSEKVPADFFATLATTEMTLPAGRYEMRTVSDDGVRVWIDDKRVIDNWTWHAPTEDTATVALEKGAHKVRIEHFEIDGHAQLQFWLKPVK